MTAIEKRKIKNYAILIRGGVMEYKDLPNLRIVTEDGIKPIVDLVQIEVAKQELERLELM